MPSKRGSRSTVAQERRKQRGDDRRASSRATLESAGSPATHRATVPPSAPPWRSRPASPSSPRARSRSPVVPRAAPACVLRPKAKPLVLQPRPKPSAFRPSVSVAVVPAPTQQLRRVRVRVRRPSHVQVGDREVSKEAKQETVKAATAGSSASAVKSEAKKTTETQKWFGRDPKVVIDLDDL